jgi:hypothetical protein
MRLIILYFSFVLLFIPKVMGQNEQEAVKILDKFSAKALAAPSVSMSFNLVKNDQVNIFST